MSGTQPDPILYNQLFDVGSGQALQRGRDNELLIQQKQQTIGAQELEVGARVAGAILSLPAEQRAEAYPRLVGLAQAQGFMKQAPPSYPGDEHARALAQMGVSSADLYKEQGNRTAAAGYGRSLGLGATPPAPGAAAAPGASAPAVGGPSFAGGIAGFEGGGVANPPENPRWPVAKGGPAGPHQFIASTWQDFARANPELFKDMTPEQILAARTDENLSTKATDWYAGENAKALQANGIAPTPANLGIAHALGAGGASRVLSQPDATPLAQVIPETIAQNPQYARMTVGDLKQKYARLGPVGGAPVQQATATPGAASGGPAAPAPYQVAGAPVAPPGTATAAPAPGTSAAPQQPTAPAPAPFVSALPPLQRSGLTAEQEARVNQRLQTRGADINAIDDDVRAMQTANITQRHQEKADFDKAQQDAAASADRTAHLTLAQQAAAALAEQRKQENERAAQAAALAAQNAERAAEELRLHQQSAAAAQRLAAAAGDPHLAVMMEIGPEIENGTATDARRAVYEGAYQKFIANKAVETQDPEHPDRRISVVPPESIPTMFPPPNYRPGASSNWVKGQPLPPAVKPPPLKPLPEKEREIMIDTAKRLDQVTQQSRTFKDNYANFTNASVGELANTAARNLPASKDAIDRAQWWSDYQRYKMAVRQGVSGQSLTASELAEFDKADINPGMTGDVIRRNLDSQDQVLRTAHERRVSSLAADQYSSEAIKAASGLDPAAVKAHPVSPSTPVESTKPNLPPGWTTVIP